MKKFLVFTGSRSDFSLLKNLAIEINTSKKSKLYLIATGTHFTKQYGNTSEEIFKTKISIYKKIVLRNGVKMGENENILNNSKILISHLNRVFFKVKPDAIILLGDRYETYIAAFAATLLKIKIIHIHGGEITAGSYDDLYRHSITKMSNLHFVSTNEYKKRVVQLGEEKKNIFNFGAMCNDNINSLKKIHRNQWQKSLAINNFKKNILVTYHPETLSKAKNFQNIKILLGSLENLKDTGIIFTAPNSDANSKDIIKMIRKFCKNNNNSIFRESLGHHLYLNSIKFCDVIVGNSSSGIIETGLMKKISINIGSRQQGRVKSNFTINCDFNKREIRKILNRILNNKYKIKKFVKNPYYGTNVAKKIFQTILEFKLEKLKYKKFNDLRFL